MLGFNRNPEGVLYRKGKWPAWLCAAMVIALLCHPVTSKAVEDSFHVLSYHDVVLTRGELTEDAVTLDHLINHFEWLLAHDYHPISVTDVLEAQAGKKTLPEKAVLLTFDDGYVSFYNYVFPLLKAYQFPAVLCVVGSWMDVAEDEFVEYGNSKVPRNTFVSWDHVKELDRSGLVEIASHTYDLQKEVIATPQGNGLAAGASLKYDQSGRRYESAENYRNRIRQDLAQAQENLKDHLFHPARVLVWPYGRYTETGIELAIEQGFAMAMTLNREPGRLGNLMHTGRNYVWRNPTALEFRDMLENPLEKIVSRFPLLEADSLKEAEPGEEKQLSAWLDRCSKLSPDGVFIRPFVFRDGEVKGVSPSRSLPMTEDRLLRLIWQTRTRGRTRSLLWLVNDEPSWGWKDEEMIKTWPDLGPHAPVFGLVIGGKDLSPAMIQLSRIRHNTSENLEKEETPSTRRERRQSYLKLRFGHTDQLATQALEKLEEFQIWQPYIQVHLLISWEQARELKEHKLKKLVRIFDRLVIDARGESLARLKEDLRLAPLQPTLRTHGQLLVQFSYDGTGPPQPASRQLAATLHEIEKLGISSWAYDHDWLSQKLPDMERVRPLMSSESFPWNDPEFRLWSETRAKQWQQRNQGQ